LITRPFLAVTAATFVFFVYVGVLVPLVPRYIEDELNGGELGLGLAIAAFAIVAIAVRPLIGLLVVRYGRRTVMIGGAVRAANVLIGPEGAVVETLHRATAEIIATPGFSPSGH